MNLILISHEVENEIIFQRASDGYVNATAMCKASGKRFNDYSCLVSTSEFLKELSLETGLSISELIISVRGGDTSLQGTWVHPDVAINLGQWCSPKFAVAVSKWVRDWMSGKSQKTALPSHIVRYVMNQSQIPVTHFSMLTELTFNLVAPMEMAGYTLPESMVPDISEGLMFCRWLREAKGINTDELPFYYHKYPDGRVCKAKLYPNGLLEDFRKHFHTHWVPNKAEEYFRKRDIKALPYLPKLLENSRAAMLEG